MNYISTRGDTARLSFTDVLLAGLAPDGGLYIPETYPQFSTDDIAALRELSYADLAYAIMAPLVGNAIPEPDLRGILAKTYTANIFGSEEITPILHIGDDIYLQDLSGGPSLAFKDMAMQFLGHVMDYELQRRGETITILGASSGDTVSAAEEAMRGKHNIRVFMLTPKDGMSPFQKAQAGSILDDNIFNISIDGRFDDCQDLVKVVNQDAEFKATYSIGAVNSINWGRILAQVVYHVNACLRQTTDPNQYIDIVVPSGNFGNILAAYVAKKMGFPIRRLIVSTNENVVLNEFFKTGIYEKHNVVVTSSPSMDISKASNIERLFYDVLGRNAEILSAKMQEFESTGRVDLSEYLPIIRDELGFYSEMVDHLTRLATIQLVYAESKTVIDPHTAAGVAAAQMHRDESNVPMICSETAKPTKFEDAVREALGDVPKRPDAFEGLEDREQRFYDVACDADAVKDFIRGQSN